MIAAAAVAAGLLGWLAPSLLRRLPGPDPADGAPDAYLSVAAWPWTRPLSAVLAALVVAGLGIRLGDLRVVWGLAVVVPVLVVLAIVDARTRLLPRALVLPATGLLLVAVVGEGIATASGGTAVRAVVAMLLARGVFWLLWALPGTGMGFGDVRLAALLGLALGRLGWLQLAIGLYAGVVLFALWGLGRALRLRSWAALRHELPYGPFLVLGFVLGAFWG